MKAIGLQTHIWNNNLRSTALLVGFPVLLLGMIWALCFGMILGGYLPGFENPGRASLIYMLQAAPLAVVVALVWFAIAYFANTAIIDMATGAHRVTRQEEPQLYNLLENLAISRGMRTPTLRIIESGELNAYATGLNEKQYSVTVTRGLMQALDRDELEAVLAHELAHIINRDVRTMVIASVFAGIITLMSQIIFRAIMWGGMGRSRGDGERKGNAGVFIIIALAVAAIGYVLSLVIRMALSRRREYVADAGAVELTKNPDAMIGALQKISGRAHLEAPASVQAMAIENSFSSGTELFATHPPIHKRIEALVQYAGGRVYEPEPTPEPVRSFGSDPQPGPWGSAAPPQNRAQGPWG